MAGLRNLWKRLDWLFVLVLSWIIPLGFFDLWKVSYFSTLLFWVIPILYLFPVFLHSTGHRSDNSSRKAFWLTVLEMTFMGLVLDCLFGHYTFKFGPDSLYLGVFLPAVGNLRVPIEELFFYFVAPFNFILVYFWCDYKWLSLDEGRIQRPKVGPSALLGFSGKGLAYALALILLGSLLKAYWGGVGGILPAYFTFLVAAAYVPAILLYQSLQDLVNWQALSMTSLYVLGTSVIYEPSLAIPKHWWGYQASGMMGKMFKSWSDDPQWPFPLEAILVWVVAPFSCIFMYEAARAFFNHPNPSTMGRLFPGSRAAYQPNRSPGRKPVPPIPGRNR